MASLMMIAVISVGLIGCTPASQPPSEEPAAGGPSTSKVEKVEHPK